MKTFNLGQMIVVQAAARLMAEVIENLSTEIINNKKT
jgi:hypothetical protein